MTIQRTHKANDPETVEALEYLTIRHLSSLGWPAAKIEGFLICSHSQGGLRTNAPKWLRKQQAFLLTHNKGLEDSRCEEIHTRLHSILEEQS